MKNKDIKSKRLPPKRRRHPDKEIKEPEEIIDKFDLEVSGYIECEGCVCAYCKNRNNSIICRGREVICGNCGGRNPRYHCEGQFINITEYEKETYRQEQEEELT